MRRNQQAGQALVYGLFVMISASAALFFLFNTGQLAHEKTKLVNTADAVAYSAGVMNARTLNFQAYANRAMMANTVAIAQLVSISSWVQYASNLGTYGVVAANPKFVTFYPSYYAATYAGPAMQESLNDAGALEKLARGSDLIIRHALMNAQAVAHAGLLPARQLVMDDIARLSYPDDGTVAVDDLPLTATADMPSFVSRYSGDDRTRFRDVVKTAANLDTFLPKRSWDLPAMWSDCPSATAAGRPDWLDRRGGTEMLGLDEWRALDSLSEKRWVPRNKFDVFCTGLAETPAGWGSTAAAGAASVDIDPSHYDASLLTNPGSTLLAMATSSSWDYSGLPSFYDLSADSLDAADPRLLFAIRVRRNIDQTHTSQARSAIARSRQLNAYQAQPAGGDEMVAVSASEVFFQRDAMSRDNLYGQGLDKPREIGSLFNPYWHVHLIQSDADVRRAQALQGALTP